MKKNYYRIFGVLFKVIYVQIKNVFYKFFFKYYLDKYRGSEVLYDKFQEISEVYNVFGNYEERKIYDREFVVDGQLCIEYIFLYYLLVFFFKFL